ncbi:MAG: undecaprenyl-diphosphate phosphatase [Flavobacteriales bacterium]|nr:undecaprenyl-diphosphate phosphatase [Flavobacteriales bacterium]MDG1440435.1 undecaprenyl-diphosphate phosphatase [Flavobacteriales bacterium]MDG1798279.1 undecaprenyl-diphosphate phosphatase [Flavobacteriales bacterium]
MDYIIAFFLGIIQGLTEFLPVSSSGHLEIVKGIFKTDYEAKESLVMTVVLHFATALSTLFIFKNDILKILKGVFTKKINEEKIFALKIIISMIPAVIIGLFFEEIIEQFFNGQLILVGFMLILTGFLLFLADKSKQTINEISYLNSLIIGIAQAIAILPGISRSGATIATSVILGIDKSSSAKFSFLMVVPLIFGKVLKDLLSGDILSESIAVGPLIIGFIGAFLTGLFACKWMIKLVKASQLKYFSFYCFFIALITILWKTI